MPGVKPYVREAGSGPAVICLHANASTSSQWRDLIELLSPTRRVLAPDLYGAGKSPDWPSRTEIALADELEFIEPVLASAGNPLTLVGHSYGGAVAMLAALRDPTRVSSLVLYEPTLFSIVDTDVPPPNGADGIRDILRASAAALDAGDRDSAAMHFIDFWMGVGTWAATSEGRRRAISDSMVNVRRWGHALFGEATPVAAFAGLNMPVLFMLGGASPESSRSVGRLLVQVLPRVRIVEFDGVGHMGPVTHREMINAEIAKFLHEG